MLFLFMFYDMQKNNKVILNWTENLRYNFVEWRRVFLIVRTWKQLKFDIVKIHSSN